MKQSAFDFAKIENSTPMMKQYLTIKSQHPDCLLFYRMGDFYEMFYEDATIAAGILGITLTKRGKAEGQDIPMCGVPYHASDAYLKTLISAGYKVAICEQTESPEEAKKRGYKAVVNREVVRIITPGTITDENILATKRSNYLVSLIEQADIIYFAYSDISTGEVLISCCNLNFLAIELSRIKPSEILCSEKLLSHSSFMEQIKNFRNLLSLQVNSFFELNKTANRFKAYYKASFIESLGDFSAPQIQALGSLLEYIYLTQKHSILALQFPKTDQLANYMIIDQATRKSLELTESQNSKTDSSLLNTIDNTCTPIGSRLIHQYISAPLIDKEIINSRLDIIENFVNNAQFLTGLKKTLTAIGDTQRGFTKLIVGRGSPRDLLSLSSDLENFSKIKQLIIREFDFINPLLENYLNQLEGFEEIIKFIRSTIKESAPILTGDGGFIKAGVNQELDDLIHLRENIDSKISALKQKYIIQTGINNLKLSRNNIIGYFVDISPSQLEKIDKNTFILRQSMVNSSRFTTNELKALEEQITSSSAQILSIELSLFQTIIEKLHTYFETIIMACQAIAVIDVSLSMATLATENNYTRPLITDDGSFILKNARHPVVEKFVGLDSAQFTPNDINLDDNSRIMLITGPNMAGKSTFLRQNAICAILAQIGSYVPSDYAKIGVVDRIFSRVGASDNLAEGKSTFMVEMIETAAILNQATDKSFVILDEIGRGTATYDGVSIARSVVEYIANRINCRTLFATHYHELICLENEFPQINNYTMLIKEWKNTVIFLHKVIKGSADKSYGIHVAALAGFPPTVIERANQILANYENNFIDNKGFDPLHNPIGSSQAMDLISEIELDEVSPKQALDLIYKLKQLA